MPAPPPQVHAYVSTGLASSKFGIRNSHLQVGLLAGRGAIGIKSGGGIVAQGSKLRHAALSLGLPY